MRHTTCFAVLCVLLVGTAGLAQGTIKAVGQSTVLVAPDQVVLSFTVRVDNREMAVARDQAAQRMAAVLKAARALGIATLEISTSNLTVQPLAKSAPGATMDEYPGRIGTVRDIVAYRVENSVAMSALGTPEELGRFGSQLADVAVKNGATSIDDMSFGKKDTVAEYRQALEQATRDAVENARAVARGLGVTIKSFSYGGMIGEGGGGDYGGEGAVFHLSAGPEPRLATSPGPPSPVEIKTLPITTSAWVTATY